MIVGKRLPQPRRRLRNGVRRCDADCVEPFRLRQLLDQGAELFAS
jgi:hypothetical protein